MSPCRTVLGLVLALALSGCSAGGPGPTEQPGSTTAGSSPEAGAGIAVRRGDLVLKYTLDASTAAGSRIRLVPNDRLRFVPGAASGSRRVTEGERLGVLRVRRSVLAALAAAGTGASASTEASLRSQERSLVAPVDGFLRQASSGPTLEAPGLDVVAVLSPVQYLRYLSLPFEGSARVETVLGPMTVRCSALWSIPAAEATNDAAASLHCRLPAQIETAPGLRSTVTIASATVKDALLVPNLCIGYDASADQYFVTTVGGGRTRRTPVQVGPSDGVVRVVRGDLRAGDLLAPADAEGP